MAVPAPALVLALIDFQNPVVLAVIVGWILSVGMHEFGHGIAAYLAGDYTIRERGGLTLNPVQYLDPLTSIVFPTIFLIMGGLPLPGGVTFVRRDLIKNPFANCAVSLAGPAVNFLLFLLCALLLQPHWGPLRPPPDLHDWSTLQLFAATMAYLQFLVCILNLLPAPPLDGFQAISFFMPADLRERAMNPQYRVIILIGLFVALSNWPQFWNAVTHWFILFLGHCGFSVEDASRLVRAFAHAIFDQAT